MIRECPIFIRPHSKAILSRAIHNDTEFLAQQMVMDYSLLVGIDEARSELVTGIIGESHSATTTRSVEENACYENALWACHAFLPHEN